MLAGQAGEGEVFIVYFRKSVRHLPDPTALYLIKTQSKSTVVCNLKLIPSRNL